MTLRYRFHKIARAGFRFAVAAIFLYLGITALRSPELEAALWLSPALSNFISNFIAPSLFMSIIGVIEIIVAASIVSGVLIKIGLGIAALIFLIIVINHGAYASFSGVNATSIRDLIILMGVIYLFSEEL